MLHLKRTAALASAAIVTVALAACSTAPEPELEAQPVVVDSAPVVPDAGEVEVLEATFPVSVDEYVRDFTLSGGANDLDGLNGEYQAAARAFPYALPDGYDWPATPGLADDPDDPAIWERGNGVAAAYFYWEGATALAGLNAAQRGDQPAADAYLDALAVAASEGVRGMYVIDDTYVARDLAPAYEGDWSGLAATAIDSFAANAENLALASAAGDHYDRGAAAP